MCQTVWTEENYLVYWQTESAELFTVFSTKTSTMVQVSTDRLQLLLFFPWCIHFFSQHFQILRLNLWSHSRNLRHFSRMLSCASHSATPVVLVMFVTTAHSTNSCSCDWHHCFPSCSSWRLFPFSYSHWCRTLAFSMSEAMARSVGWWLRENNKPKCCKTQTSKYVSTVWQ